MTTIEAAKTSVDDFMIWNPMYITYKPHIEILNHTHASMLSLQHQLTRKTYDHMPDSSRTNPTVARDRGSSLRTIDLEVYLGISHLPGSSLTRTYTFEEASQGWRHLHELYDHVLEQLHGSQAQLERVLCSDWHHSRRMRIYRDNERLTDDLQTHAFDDSKQTI